MRKEHLVVRFTRRGPIVSDLFRTLGNKRLLSLRWAPAENLGPEVGIRRLFEARSAQEVREAAQQLHTLLLNIVFADVEGNIGWQPSGRLPIRSHGGQMLPTPVQGEADNWTGWITGEEMPQLFNPAKGWVGSANHYVVPAEYPYYYSTYAAPSHRYRRIRELLSAPGIKKVDDHWAYQRDQENLMAASLAPVMARALAKAPDTKALADILAESTPVLVSKTIGKNETAAVGIPCQEEVNHNPMVASNAPLTTINCHFGEAGDGLLPAESSSRISRSSSGYIHNSKAQISNKAAIAGGNPTIIQSRKEMTCGGSSLASAATAIAFAGVPIRLPMPPRLAATAMPSGSPLPALESVPN